MKPETGAFLAKSRELLGRTYNLKAIADYETAPGSNVTVAQATEAIDKRFVAAVIALIPTVP